RYWRSALVCVILLALSAGVSRSAAQQMLVNYKLSAAQSSAGGVDDAFQISPDGAYVVYIDYRTADDGSGRTGGELYSTRLDGSEAPIRLSELLPDGLNVIDFQITLNGEYVVYRQEQPLGGDKLYSVPIAGGTINELSGLLADQSILYSYRVSPNGQFVVYMEENSFLDDILNLFSIPIEGGIPQRLSNDLLSGIVEIKAFEISPDSNWVVYTSNEENTVEYDLYSVPIGGGEIKRLNMALDNFEEVFNFQISPDSSQVVYRLLSTAGNAPEKLFRVPIDGGLTFELDEKANFRSYQISPDGSTLVYGAREEVDGALELYRVPLDQISFGESLVVKLSGLLTVDGGVQGFRISPDGTRVVYAADQQTNDKTELYTVSMEGGQVEKLNDVLMADGDVGRYWISVDGLRVIYLADAQVNGVSELFSVPIEGGSVEKLNGELVDNGFVTDDLRLSADGSYVVYRADQEVDGRLELYRVPVAGGPVQKMSGPLVDGGAVSFSFEISPNDDHVVYVADQEVDGLTELFASTLNNLPEFASISDQTAAAGEPYSLTIEALDADSDDRLTIEALDLPAWLILSDSGNRTWTLSGTPGIEDVGNLMITLQVLDSAGGVGLTTFTLEVEGEPGIAEEVSSIYLPMIWE
ncbi:MAG: putative Ig domain-containing protein, partial [Chloroflexota bacterium]